MHIILLFNGSPEDPNNFKINIQKPLKQFNHKAQAWKEKIQTCTDPSKVSFIMYRDNTLQVNLLVNNVLSGIKQEKDLDTEVAIQSEIAFLKN